VQNVKDGESLRFREFSKAFPEPLAEQWVEGIEYLGIRELFFLKNDWHTGSEFIPKKQDDTIWVLSVF
jgi:hypothetical protein